MKYFYVGLIGYLDCASVIRVMFDVLLVNAEHRHWIGQVIEQSVDARV